MPKNSCTISGPTKIDYIEEDEYVFYIKCNRIADAKKLEQDISPKLKKQGWRVIRGITRQTEILLEKTDPKKGEPQEVRAFLDKKAKKRGM